MPPLTDTARSQGDLAYGLALKTLGLFLARGVAAKVDREEMEGAVLEAAANALHRFDPDRGVALSTHIICRVKFAIREELRRQDWLTRGDRHSVNRMIAEGAPLPEWALPPLSLSECCEDGEGNDGESLVEQLPDAANVEAEAMLRCRSQELLALLTPRERELVLLYLWQGHTLKEIAARFQRSESRIHQIWADALARMRAVARAWMDAPSTERKPRDIMVTERLNGHSINGHRDEAPRETAEGSDSPSLMERLIAAVERRGLNLAERFPLDVRMELAEEIRSTPTSVSAYLSDLRKNRGVKAPPPVPPVRASATEEVKRRGGEEVTPAAGLVPVASPPHPLTSSPLQSPPPPPPMNDALSALVRVALEHGWRSIEPEAFREPVRLILETITGGAA